MSPHNQPSKQQVSCVVCHQPITETRPGTWGIALSNAKHLECQHIHGELVAAGCGLHANSQNPDFRPGQEAVARWANLMLRGADEIERLTMERDACLRRLSENDEEIERLRAALDRLVRACDDYVVDKMPGAVWDEEVERARASIEAAPRDETTAATESKCP